MKGVEVVLERKEVNMIKKMIEMIIITTIILIVIMLMMVLDIGEMIIFHRSPQLK